MNAKKMFNNIVDKIKSYSVKRIVLISIVFLFTLLIVFSFFRKSTNKDFIDTTKHNTNYQGTSNLIGGNVSYTNKYLEYKEANLKFVNEDIKFGNDSFNGHVVDVGNEEYGEIVKKYQNQTGNNYVYMIDDQKKITFTANNIEDGIHYLALDYYELNNMMDNNQISIRINGKLQFHESSNLVLKSKWDFANKEFALDRYGNEIQPGAVKIYEWNKQAINDYYGIHPGYYGFQINNGDTIEISSLNNELLIGSIYTISQTEIISYKDYLTENQNHSLVKSKIEVSARDLISRSEASIRLRSEQNPKNLYYDTQKLKLNTIFSESWQNGGQKVGYNIKVAETGFYNISFKYRQNLLNDMPVYRKIYINGEVPFDLFESYAFPYTTGFLNRVVQDENGKEVKVLLQKGDNLLELEAVNYPYRTTIEKIKEIMAEIQSLSLKIKNYTGGNSSSFQDWDIEKDFPTAKGELIRWADELDELYESIKGVSKINKPAEISNLTQSAKKLRGLAKNINKLPSKMIQFSDGDSSVSQMLGATMQRLMISGIELERITVYGNTKITKPYANIFVSFYEETKRLILSFVNNPYSSSKNKKDELTVWVNHPRQYIEIMQSMIDEKYKGSRRITLSQMPDQTKLILANAGGSAPDVALGVDHWIPYDFAIRDAALDLRQFEGYTDTVSNFSKGSMIPYIFEDGVYGIPETQNFWVTYYRKDILESIGVTEIPQTWDEIKAILPLLQSYQLNYFIPLAQYNGLKPFVATLPFIDQFGGSLYNEDGMSTAINSVETLEGMKLMAELFTLYNMPKFVASFYNQFRYGLLPIGVSDLSTYILLETTALELDGLWDIDLHPGNYNEEKDEVVRYAPAGAQSSMIMSTTKYKQESWDFLSWWMSTEVQSEFAFTLQNTYGKAYFWNTANLEAFNSIPIAKKHREVILKQWEYASEGPRIPGSYMVEREISNAWTSMVFDGVNPRFALDEAVRISNREILYKMSEFGYVDKGVIIKNYPVPTLENIDKWLVEVYK